MKHVQIISVTEKMIETPREAIEDFRKKIEDHINNGWEIKTTNVVKLTDSQKVRYYAVMVKED